LREIPGVNKKKVGVMFKIFGILKRPKDVPFDVFKSWWLNEHAPRVKEWEELFKHRINFLCLF